MTLSLSFKQPAAGTLALVGAGEYLPAMQVVDRALLEHVGGPVRVACLSTGAGTEGAERIHYWDELGVNHFRALGVAEVQAVPVTDRAGAEDMRLAEQVARANFVYLSGGKPYYLLETLKDTPVLKAILGVMQAGGVVAGCSAGAMIWGGRIPKGPFFSGAQDGFALLPGTFIMPHFNELPAAISGLLPALIRQQLLVGIDGYTALVCRAGEARVLGSGGVTLAHGSDHHRFAGGESIETAAA